VLWVTPSDDYLLLPDKAKPVAPLVTIKNAKPASTPGGIYFVDVLQRQATLFESIFPSVRDGSTLVSPSAVRPPGVSEGEQRRADVQAMALSQDVAAAVALKELGYKVTTQPNGVMVAGIGQDTPAAGQLKLADIIVAVDGKRVRTPEDLRRLITRHRPGETVRLTVRRSSRLQQIVLKTIAGTNPPRAIIGIDPAQAVQFALPFPVRIDTGEIGGPSAGLAFALEILEKLGRDVDRGHKVAATGELFLDGTVHPIGGVKQKVFGAKQAGVDIFLVPAGENATEARRYAGKLRIVPVQSFRQALRALATLPPKD
jgi:PDZ domain-containing protein